MDQTTAIAAFSATGSAVAASAAWLQVRRAAQANEAVAFLQLLSAYSSPEMRDAVSHLAAFWRQAARHGRSVEDHYEKIVDSDKALADLTRERCRQVSSYFVDAWRLYQSRLITKKVLKTAIFHPGLNVFYEVAVPLNRMKNGGHNSIVAAGCLKRICLSHGNGIY